MVGGGTGPATGTSATTCTPGPWYIARMLQAFEGLPMNFVLSGKGNASRPQALEDEFAAGGIEPFPPLDVPLDELRASAGLLGALFGAGGSPLAGMFGGGQPGGQPGDPGAVTFGFTPADAQQPDGPVDWTLADRVARQVAAPDDRDPTEEETARLTEAVRLAEHWLDASALPAPPDAGRVRIGSRADWITDAIAGCARMNWSAAARRETLWRSHTAAMRPALSIISGVAAR